MARIDVLRDGLGGRIGTAAVFHPVERLDALPHGDCGDDTTVQTSQRDLEERLDACFDDFVRGGIPLGILWIEVDQAAELRRTHGLRACEAMLEIVAHSLGNGLRPTDELGRWGEDEFLVIAHERASEMLIDHAQTLAGLARTADFRWWGDRISLTASIGAAQAVEGDLLAALLARAQAAMEASVHSGGNHVTHAAGGLTCSQS
jgi:diguanylate cyclase (GGDEF)-like protein